MAFDPDAYLNDSKGGFDPDAYLGGGTEIGSQWAQKNVPEILKQAGQAALASDPALLSKKFMETDPATMQRVGGPALPIVGGMLGGPIGAAGGELARQASGTAFAPETVPQTALGRFGSTVSAGVMQDPKILNAIPGVPQVAEMVGNLASKTGKGMAKAAQALSGGKAGDFLETLKKGIPTYSAPSKQEAGRLMGKAIDRLPQEMEFIPPEPSIPMKPTYGDDAKPLLDEFGNVLKRDIKPPSEVWKGPFKSGPTMEETITSALTPEAAAGNKFLTDMGKRLDQGELIDARQALKAKQSLDDVIDTVPFWQTKRRAKLFDLKNTFDDVLKNQSGELKEASNTYRAAVLKDNMTKFLPVNKHGEYSRLAPMLASLGSSLGGGLGAHSGGAKGGILGGLTPMATMVALSPGVLGGGAALTGSAINTIAQNPAARQVLMQLLLKLQQNKKEDETP